ncbi:MAG TPA: tripartite tricarboxylate transporter substrate binding protein [Xanthobacteraceae bacterium]|nr:tripartite tricarboxylate transporter substrate binding protein [Xanthobacteraceae bacterium]
MPPFARSFRAILFLLGVLSLGAGAAGAQSWPARTITLVVAFPPSTTTDFAARAIAQELSKEWGQSVVVENRTAGGGVVASLTVAKAPPDGYTLLMTTIGPAVLRPLIDSKLHYDAVADFTPIVLVGEAPNLLVSSPKLNISDVRGLVTHAKANPGRLTIGHPGIGTMGHLIGLLFASEAGIEANFISYAGSPPLLTDLAGGTIDAGSIAYGAPVGSSKVLAVTTQERLAFLPGVPTMRESGFPNVTGATWSGLFGPAGLPPAIVAKLNQSINALLRKDETRQLFDKAGYHGLGGPPERLRQQMADDRAKWSKVIAAAKLSLDP